MKLQTNEQALTILQRLENLNTSVISLQNRKIEQQDLLIGNLRIMLESQEKLMDSHSTLLAALKQVAAEWFEDPGHACGHNSASPELKALVHEALKKANKLT